MFHPLYTLVVVYYTHGWRFRFPWKLAKRPGPIVEVQQKPYTTRFRRKFSTHLQGNGVSDMDLLQRPKEVIDTRRAPQGPVALLEVFYGDLRSPWLLTTY